MSPWICFHKVIFVAAAGSEKGSSLSQSGPNCFLFKYCNRRGEHRKYFINVLQFLHCPNTSWGGLRSGCIRLALSFQYVAPEDRFHPMRHKASFVLDMPTLIQTFWHMVTVLLYLNWAKLAGSCSDALCRLRSALSPHPYTSSAVRNPAQEQRQIWRWMEVYNKKDKTVMYTGWYTAETVYSNYLSEMLHQIITK